MSLLLSHWIVPLAAASLPWRAGFRLLAKAAASGAVTVANEDAAWNGWRRWRDRVAGGADAAPRDEAGWKSQWRLVQLVDHADLFLALSRRDRWLDRHADVSGSWPARGPFLAVTAHWGAGLWALRHLGRGGATARFLSRRFDARSFPGDPAYTRYLHARARAVERACGAPMIYTGGAIAEIVATWSAGSSVVALYDVGAGGDASAMVARLSGATFGMPGGLIREACARAIPVVPFSGGVDPARGRRRIEIGEARVYATQAELCAMLGAHLAKLLANDAVAWHMWPYADEILAVAPDATQAGGNPRHAVL